MRTEPPVGDQDEPFAAVRRRGTPRVLDRIAGRTVTPDETDRWRRLDLRGQACLRAWRGCGPAPATPAAAAPPAGRGGGSGGGSGCRSRGKRDQGSDERSAFRVRG